MGRGRGRFVSLYVTEEEASKVRASAAAAGVSVSELVRGRCRSLSARVQQVPSVFDAVVLERVKSAGGRLNTLARAANVQRLEGREIDQGSISAALEELAEFLEAFLASARG